VYDRLPERPVTLRESGVSSTLQPLDSIISVSEYWIARRSLSSGAHSRDPLAGDDRRVTSPLMAGFLIQLSNSQFSSSLRGARRRSNPFRHAKKDGLLPPTHKGASADSKPAIARIASDGGSSLALLAITAARAAAFPQRGSRPSCCTNYPQKDRGRRESRVLAAPIASHATKKRTSVVATGSPKQSGLPCAMVYGL
jgi:hypothetical protein